MAEASLVFQTPCPACGAQVAFRSAASVLAVCAYCQSTLLREADAVRDIGKMGKVLEDWSRIQIGTSGVFLNIAFTVVGRLQLVYEHGYWNEWHAVLDDGSSAWLSESGGQYVLTAAARTTGQWPEFERIVPGGTLTHEGSTYTAADVRTAQCKGGEGELPFRAREGWQARVADFRAGNLFLTLDYSDGAAVAYVGKRVTLEALKCQNLRSDQQIVASAGRLAGGAGKLDCPNCGAPIAYRQGMTRHLVCPSCHAELAPAAADAAGQGTRQEAFSVLARHDALEARSTTFALGDQARIEGRMWTLIGLIERRELGGVEESSAWVEYLLHNPNKGLRWLVESLDGWDLVEVLDEWPVSVEGGVKLRGLHYRQGESYRAEVSWAAGAFNWRVQVGDEVSITDYRAGAQSLSAERDRCELSWSHAKRVPTNAVMRWFGKTAPADEPETVSEDSEISTRSFCHVAAIAFTVLLVLINLPFIFSPNGDLAWPIMGLFALWWPIFKYDDELSGADD